MRRFTHSLLATSLLFSATAISAQETGISNERMLTGTTAGDYSSMYTYDQHQRLTSVESLASKVTFDYSPATLDNEEYDATMRISDPSGDIICYLQIGDNGFITKSREIEEAMGEQAPYKTFTFSYDTDGHLTQINEVGIVEFSSTTFEYTDGNLTSATTIGSSPSSSSISYASATQRDRTANTAGMMDFSIFGNDDIETGYFFTAGLLGTATTHLPARCEMTADGITSADTYVWNIDSEGLPTSRTTISENASARSTEYAWTDTSALADNMADSDHSAQAWYGLNGMCLDNPSQGINIIQKADGTATKTLRR